VFQSYKIGWDIAMIRNAIFAANGIAGIDFILSNIDHLNILKSDAQQILKKLTGKTDPLIEFALYKKAIASKDETPTFAAIDIWNKDEIDDLIKKINRQIAQLETQRDKLNTETIVTLHLSDESIEVLGI
jgi:prefoldin subunit 5